MILNKILDRIYSLVEGAEIVPDNNYDFGWGVSTLNNFRAQYLRNLYLRNKRINPICYQKYYPDFESAFQNTGACFAKFVVPNVISLDSNSDGFRYVGSIGDDGDSEAFIRVQSRAWLSTYNNHPVTNVNNDRGVYYLYDGAMHTLELYGNGKLVKSPMVEAIFANPLEVPTYNIDKDDYPLPEDCLPEIETMIFAGQTRIIESTTPTPAFQPQMMPKK